MKTLFYNVWTVLLLVLIIPVGIWGMITLSDVGTKQQQAKLHAEGCFASNKLRVKIGDTVFAFPRSDIKDMAGPDVPWSGEPHHSKKVKPEKVCQKENAVDMSVDNLSLRPNVRPVLCVDKCTKYSSHGTRLFGSIIRVSDLSNYNNIPILRSDYISKCKNKPYFNTCKHFVTYRDIRFGFQYYLDSFPLERIEETEGLILEYLKSHDITNPKGEE
ncbi:MAG: hypothetical protein ACRBCK_11230 [Alphaproteobacteria bacterium]